MNQFSVSLTTIPSLDRLNHKMLLESLEAALYSIRISQSVIGVEQPAKYWVDAICINQADPQEVKREILRMKEIYSQAMTVYVHLGPETEDSDLGFQVLQRIAEDLSDDVDVYLEVLRKRLRATEEDKKAYKAALRILNRPYWNRVWILQELAMSRGDVVFACGANEIPLEKIRPASKFFSVNGETILVLLGIGNPENWQLFTISLTLQLYIVTWTNERRKRRTQQSIIPQQLTYLDLRQPLLTLAQSAQATRLHDNVYGLLGLAPDPICKSMESYIDYDLPVEIVFVVIFAKSYSQTMDPSWATDWSLAFDRAGFPHDWELYCYDQFDGAYDNLRDVINSSCTSRADGARKSEVTFPPSDNAVLLKCSGFLVGRVDGMALTLPVTNAVSLVEHYQPVATANPYGDDEATARALIHTLFANSKWGDAGGASLFHIPWFAEDPSTFFGADGSLNLTPGDIASISQLNTHGWSSALGTNFFQFEWLRRRLSQFRIGNKTFQEYFDTKITQCEFPAQRIKLDVATCLGAYLKRRLITLDTGHFGLAPCTIERGDAIYVLLGCSLPMVLRQVGETGRFKVVGECYVDGIANGEALAGVESGCNVIRDIVLC
ncbi:hypothetical protein N0V90_010232 [Kalmusia sp. IMI 367209]|nr:hypothetical protein N0V90_010232 [Kalmusia sp. IMI 367209]